MTSADQFQSFRTSYELREFPESHPNLTSVVRVFKTSSCMSFPERITSSFVLVFQSILRLFVARVSGAVYGSYIELREFSRASYVEFARVFQSVLRLLVVRVSRASYGSCIELREFSRASDVELLCEVSRSRSER